MANARSVDPRIRLHNMEALAQMVVVAILAIGMVFALLMVLRAVMM